MLKDELVKYFKESKADAYISEAPQTRLWFAGVQTTDVYLVIEPNKAYLFVDGRYIEYCTKNAKNVEVILLEKGTWSTPFNKTEQWQKVKEACEISLQALEEVKKILRVGITELEVSNKLGYLMKVFGAEKEGFDSIVAFGANAAEPHHHPTNKKLTEGDIVKIDFGAQFAGWVSDITRTFFFGKPKNPDLVKILDTVIEAQRLGREMVKPGVTTVDVDKTCRDYIEKAGYGKFFTHSTGHGVGIDIHELPYVNSSIPTTLEEGMIITVEPGIYVENVGGARIEDTILVTKDGCRVLSRPEDYK